MKRICVVTGNRADYGLLRWVMEGIKTSKVLELQLVVTGAHLSEEYGYTIAEIIRDGFTPDRKVEMLLSSDTSVGITKSMGVSLIGFADALDTLKPDLLIVLGDRYEIFVAAAAAMMARIPIAHIHGGELTLGAVDDAIRHSITKMSHLHFVSTEKYRQRVMQLGENPKYIYNVGAVGIDNILRVKLLERADVEKALNFHFLKKNLLVTFHPETLKPGLSAKHLNEMLIALSQLKDTGIIFTLPNADHEGRFLSAQIMDFCRSKPSAIARASFGQQLYLSCMCHVDGVIGNSSSGIIEAPSLKKGSINIGQRQKGRISAESVINSEATALEISDAIKTLFSREFQEKLCNVINPYGQGGTSQKVVQILEDVEGSDLLAKDFHSVTNHL